MLEILIGCCVAAAVIGVVTYLTSEKTIDTKSEPSLFDLIKKRRSIFTKDFTGGDVPDEAIHEMLEAANWAPTHGKTEPWRFVVLRTRAAIDEVLAIKSKHTEESLKDKPEKLEAMMGKIKSKEKEMQNVGAIIVIVTKRVPNSKGKLMPEWEEIAATSCAVQNMHLMLTTRWSQGLGGYWSSGGYDAWLNCQAMREYCDADGQVEGEDDKILGLFYLGQAKVSKMDSYRAKRGAIAEKATWK